MQGKANMRSLEKQVESLINDVAQHTFKTAKSLTPVRSGRARDNWTKDTTRQGFEVENTVPYIGHLDKGSSKQAPRGITKPTVRKVTGFIRTRRLSR
tara:strand:+ start:6307 stop:6597 length:291 start_codon:yes stop_codon:yes gene_type:complete